VQTLSPSRKISKINMFNIGIVVIGRNEGERLIRCLQSLQDTIQNSVYVDSASSDNSVQTAKNLGAHTMVLDMSIPFTAARARNVGFAELLTLYPQTEFVQFVDGDSEIVNNWLSEAAQFLHDNQAIAVVSGILSERFPEKTIYNTLCDLEWKMPKGEVKSCGGNAMMRVSAFKQVNGYLPTLAAGEEPEMCVRLRQNGWKVWHLHHAMMLHDANMTSFKQWWKRTLRGGYAFAEGAFLHGKAPEFHWVAESKRAWLWGFFIPLAILIAFFIKPVWGLLLSFLYPIQLLRLAFKSKLPFKVAFLQAFFLVIGKFAELVGQVKFLLHRFCRKQNKNVACK
jgi:GT2 family glycosyltransferase